MKESNEWIRQPMVDKAADEIVAARGCTPAEVRPYQVAKHLGCEPNSSIYDKMRDWRHRRQDEAQAATIEVPPAAEAEFRATLDRLMAEAGDHFVRAVRMVGSALDRAAALRIADAERRRTEAEGDAAEVLDLCQKAEAELAAANIKIGVLEKELAVAQRREDNLRGRLEQREADATRLAAAERHDLAATTETVSRTDEDVADAGAPVQQTMPFHDAGGDTP